MASWALKTLLLMTLLVAAAMAAPTTRLRRHALRRGEIDHTVVQIAEVDNADQSEEFYVTVIHVEDDVDDKTGQVDAERRTTVALKFDVLPDLTVTVNGQAVKQGASELKVQGSVVNTGIVDKLHPVQELKVQIFVGLEQLVDGQGKKYHHVVIQERIIEVEDDRVWQATVRQQMIDVHEDGKLIKKSAVMEIAESMSMLPPPPKAGHDEDDDDDQDKHKHKEGHHDGDKNKHKDKNDKHKNKDKGKHKDDDHTTDMDDNNNNNNDEMTNSHMDAIKATLLEWKNAVMDWYHSLPFVVRIIVAFLVGMVAGFVVIGLASCIGSCCGIKCTKCTKKRSNDVNPPEYTAAYALVPLDEKKEKNEAESGSAELV